MRYHLVNNVRWVNPTGQPQLIPKLLVQLAEGHNSLGHVMLAAAQECSTPVLISNHLELDQETSDALERISILSVKPLEIDDELQIAREIAGQDISARDVSRMIDSVPTRVESTSTNWNEEDNDQLILPSWQGELDPPSATEYASILARGGEKKLGTEPGLSEMLEERIEHFGLSGLTHRERHIQQTLAIRADGGEWHRCTLHWESPQTWWVSFSINGTPVTILSRQRDPLWQRIREQIREALHA